MKVFCYHGNKSTILLFYSILEELLKFLANFTLLKYVKSQRSYGFLITKELIFGFQILDLKVHFSASLIESQKIYFLPADQQFFQNRDYLVKLWDVKDSIASLKKLPGHGYFNKIYDFMGKHCEIGELYIECRKNNCQLHLQGQKCDYCKTHPSVCDSVTPVPRPHPDHKKLPIFHYNTHSSTPVYKEDGITPREIDDFNPRVQIKKQFECGNLSSGDAEAIKSISRLCIIPEEFVLKRVRHLEHLKLKRTKRAESTKRRAEREKNKGFDEYNWRDLYYSGKIDKLPGHVLDKYITHYNLERKRLVAEKLHLVKQHIQKGFATFAGHTEDRSPCHIGYRFK